MAFQATVIPVMIASPGDVSEEREIIRQVIHEWNDIYAARMKVMLSPVGWETHSSPELGMRPQELVNSRVLRHCDLLVGVFWTRLGTPTGKASSGTVEEIQEHIAAGKPAMIYFSSKPVAPESVDPQQFSELHAFKMQCKEKGLIEQFDNSSEFRGKFSKQLALSLSQNEYLQNLIAPVDSSNQGRTPARETLSPDAITLVKAAASTNVGMILRREFIDGQSIDAGDESFGKENRREFARWCSAIDELISHALISNSEKDLYELTHKGWLLAESA